LDSGCELADWAECGSVRKDALMTRVFAMNFPYISSERASRTKMLAETKGWSENLSANPIQRIAL
jgi:hypothetical protein